MTTQDLQNEVYQQLHITGCYLCVTMCNWWLPLTDEETEAQKDEAVCPSGFRSSVQPHHFSIYLPVLLGKCSRKAAPCPHGKCRDWALWVLVTRHSPPQTYNPRTKARRLDLKSKSSGLHQSEDELEKNWKWGKQVWCPKVYLQKRMDLGGSIYP